MSSAGITAVLIASSEHESLADFCRRAFEWELPQRHGPDHVGFTLPHIYLGFERNRDDVPGGHGPVSLWFNVADIDSVFARLVHNGARVNYAPTRDESPGEILATVYDPDGNLIGLISPL